MKTSKNIIIGLLIVIIMILAALVVLFATGTLAFHTKGNFNNQIEETSQTENNQSNFSKDDQSSDLNYQFGDDLKIDLSKLTMIEKELQTVKPNEFTSRLFALDNRSFYKHNL